MMSELGGYFSQFYTTISTVIFVLTVLLHLFFASAVAKDIGHLSQNHVSPKLLPATVWVLAALIGGIVVVAVYWLIHHSTLNRG